MRSCQEITELVSKKLDTSLAFTTQVELKMHLLLCKNCHRYAQQLQSIQSLLTHTKSDLSSATLSPKAKTRINNALTHAQTETGSTND